jgi:hypothetical protein
MSFIGSSVRRELSSRKLPIVMLIILHDPLLWFLLVTKWVRTLEMPPAKPPGGGAGLALALVPGVLVPPPPPDLLHDSRTGHLPPEPLKQLLPVHLLVARVHLRVVVLGVGRRRGGGRGGGGREEGGRGRRSPREGDEGGPGVRPEETRCRR